MRKSKDEVNQVSDQAEAGLRSHLHLSSTTGTRGSVFGKTPFTMRHKRVCDGTVQYSTCLDALWVPWYPRRPAGGDAGDGPMAGVMLL